MRGSETSSRILLELVGPCLLVDEVVTFQKIGTTLEWHHANINVYLPGLTSLTVYGGLIVFAACLLYDTQRVVKLATEYPHKEQFGGTIGDTVAYDRGYGASQPKPFDRRVKHGSVVEKL